MSIHTFVCLGGKRLVIQPSRTTQGAVQVQVLSADRSVQASITCDAPTAGVISQAFGISAAEAETHKAMLNAADNVTPLQSKVARLIAGGAS